LGEAKGEQMISRAGQSKTVEIVGIQKKASKDEDVSLINKEVNSDNLHQTYAHTLSGILDEGKRKTMPAFMEKLAEEEAAILDENEPGIDLINVEFDDEPLTRGNDVTNDDSRRIEGFEIAKPSEEKMQKETEVLLAEGHDLPDIAQELKRKFPEKAVEKFVETHQKELLQKYGQLGFIYLDKRLYDSCEDMKEHLARLPSRNLLTKLKESENAKVKCRDCTKYKSGYCLLTNLKVSNTPEITTDREAKSVINKFASVDISIRDEFIERLAVENPAKVISEFLASIENLRRDSGKKDSIFKRDNDQKVMKERLIDNNDAKNAAIEEEKLNHTILQDLKSHIEAGHDIKAAHKLLTQTYTPTQLENVYTKYATEIDKFEKFCNRNKEAKIERFENEGSKKDVVTAKNKSVKEKELFKKMMNHADLMLSEGTESKDIQASLKKTFGIDETIRFMNEHQQILNKHYGQLGYVYIDSNLYENCDKMAAALAGFKHVGKSLIYNVKACQNCKECPQNAHGQCKKVQLMISNNPLIRSPRAASKMLKRAEGIISREYIEKFSKKISNFGNARIVSEFNLGLKKITEDESTVKTASVNTELQNSFRTVNAAFKTNLFTSSSVSKIAEEVMKASKEEFKKEYSSLWKNLARSYKKMIADVDINEMAENLENDIAHGRGENNAVSAKEVFKRYYKITVQDEEIK
jgi:hypothetical protein